MRYNTLYNHRRRLKLAIRDIFSSARIYSAKPSQLFGMMERRVYSDGGYKRVPAWVRSELKGYYDAYWESMYTHDLEWMLCQDGKLITRDEVIDWSKLTPGCHVWKHSRKPFSDEFTEDV